VNSTSERMFDIFKGNTFSYGKDVPKDGDLAGGGLRVDQILTPALVEEHLKGTIGIGVYPTWHRPDGTLMASWGCCDIDTGDWNEAYSLATALRAMGMVPHIERSRSKGWHIWVFPDVPVTAMEMRRALKVAYAAIELPAKEANPKSEQLKPGQVGNYVRLPYKGALSRFDNAFARQTFMVGWDAKSEGFPIGPADWMYEFDTSCLTPSSTIASWASRYVEPVRKVIVGLEKLEDPTIANMINRLPGDLKLFVKNGPANDRSAGLVALGHKLRQQKYTAQEIYSLLGVADQIWGNKYSDRPDGEKWLIDIVERVVQ
jgi:hypothetical protein